MRMNLGLRRIASLSAFLVAMGIASASQAGIIPWAYDVVFGPVRYPAYGYGYSPYAVSYSRPVYVNSAPVSYGYSSGCSSCSTSYYAPVSYASPSYGCGCGPVVAAPSCGPCGGTSYAASSGGCLSGCSPTATSSPEKTEKTPATNGTNGKSAWKKPADKDPAPAPRTFQDPDRGATPAGATSTDGLGTGTRSRGTRTNEAAGNEVEVNRPATANDEPTILKPKKAPAQTTDDLFEEVLPKKAPEKINEDFQLPKENDAPANDATNGNTESTIRLPLPKLNFDAKITWRASPPLERVPFHAKFAKASVNRRVPGVDSDWTPVVGKPAGTQLVRK